VQERGAAAAPEVSVPVSPTPLAYAVAKRALDLAASGLGVVLAAPVFVVIAAAVKLDSPGPVLFRQQRVGLGGRPFLLYKFRTMDQLADEQEHQRYVSKLIKGGGSAETTEATWVPIDKDPRVTRTGSFLRRSHLDELPQLLNILRGDMSLVGPRPPIPYEVELYEPWHLDRLAVRPGMTGLWQATGWGKLSFDDGVRLDIEYVRRRSFGLDLRIMLRTAWQIVTGRQF
jgi:lipopolysaccharide/colanic/teichoic acid biosynthesis glycosyltransferase